VRIVRAAHRNPDAPAFARHALGNVATDKAGAAKYRDKFGHRASFRL